jgi:two-component system response regulator GlrR
VTIYSVRQHAARKGRNIKTLLILGDTRSLVLTALRMHADWRVVTVRNWLILLKAVNVFRPDLVILDVGLDAMDGVQVYRLLREHPYGADLPVLFITAAMVSAAVPHLTGVHAVLEKPFHHDVLVQKVTELLASYDAMPSPL